MSASKIELTAREKRAVSQAVAKQRGLLPASNALHVQSKRYGQEPGRYMAESRLFVKYFSADRPNSKGAGTRSLTALEQYDVNAEVALGVLHDENLSATVRTSLTAADSKLRGRMRSELLSFCNAPSTPLCALFPP